MKNMRLLILAALLSMAAFGEVNAQSSGNTPERFIEAVYEGATDQAGKTDYTFRRENGQTFTFSFSKTGEAQPWNPVIPDNLLEAANGTHTSAKANPELVGKTFLLVFGGEGDGVTEVRLKE